MFNQSRIIFFINPAINSDNLFGPLNVPGFTGRGFPGFPRLSGFPDFTRLSGFPGLSGFDDFLTGGGNPPRPAASPEVVSKLPEVKLRNDEEMCTICQENFVADESATQLPCKHHFHKDCLAPWLKSHNTCPVCRYELPTVNLDYNRVLERRQAQAGRPPAPASAESQPISETEVLATETKTESLGTENKNNASDSPEVPISYNAGARVQVYGLTLQTNMNGQHGVVQHFDSSTGRYHVIINAGQPSEHIIAARPRNLRASLSPSSQTFTANTRVQLHGLASHTDLNGQYGIVQHLDSSTGRYHVMLNAGRPSEHIISARPRNLRVAVNCFNLSFTAGTHVELHGLVRGANLNGAHGVVQCQDASTGRYHVLLHSNQDSNQHLVAALPHNLHIAHSSVRNLTKKKKRNRSQTDGKSPVTSDQKKVKLSCVSQGQTEAQGFRTANQGQPSADDPSTHTAGDHTSQRLI